MLEREEYVEQAHFFRVLAERLQENMPLQELLAQVREEVLATTKLPMAIDFMLAELKHGGLLAPAMARLGHYFAAFQTYVVRESESDRSRFDFVTAMEVLRFEATYRSQACDAQGMFLFQFEALCRNRLRYDHGMAAMAQDPLYDERWREWILAVRRQIGIVDLADLIYVRSQHYQTRRVLDARRQGLELENLEPERPVLFGEKEGKIALANRRKDPLYLFAAMQRHLGYPSVPRRKKVDDSQQQIPQLLRRLEQFEQRMKILEEEQKETFDISKFYVKPLDGPPDATL